jgi:dCMP deaminase
MDWNERFLQVATDVAEWSKDPSTKVGAVLTIDNHIIATGYNGTARCVEDKLEYYQYPLKDYYIIHAEINAILNSVVPTTGSTLYCTHHPCSRCAIIIAQSGIKKIYSYKRDDDFTNRWAESINIARDIFIAGGITYHEV